MKNLFISQNPRLGFAYVPYQKYENLYDIKTALKRGTIFKDLDILFKEYESDPIMNPFK